MFEVLNLMRRVFRGLHLTQFLTVLAWFIEECIIPEQYLAIVVYSDLNAAVFNQINSSFCEVRPNIGSQLTQLSSDIYTKHQTK
ncbi:MAG: hypothetical protein ACI9WC_003756 [Arenicella sp.]|jgi:hypothetical protein